MTIYTRTGDKGMTSVFGGKRVSKASKQIEATGAIDELTTYIGYVETQITDIKIKNELVEIQKDLYHIMSVMAGATVPIVYLSQRTKDFELKIDSVTSGLPKLTSFILPGGTANASLFHILRVFARRAERRTVSLKSSVAIVTYLNRLSDLFFTLARHQAKGKEQKVRV